MLIHIFPIESDWRGAWEPEMRADQQKALAVHSNLQGSGSVFPDDLTWRRTWWPSIQEPALWNGMRWHLRDGMGMSKPVGFSLLLPGPVLFLIILGKLRQYYQIWQLFFEQTCLVHVNCGEGGDKKNKHEHSGLQLCVHLDFTRIPRWVLGNGDPAYLVPYCWETDLSLG